MIEIDPVWKMGVLKLKLKIFYRNYRPNIDKCQLVTVQLWIKSLQ